MKKIFFIISLIAFYPAISTTCTSLSNPSLSSRSSKNPVVKSITPNMGSLAGNLVITIKGENLTNTTAVNFGAAGASSINILSDSVITVTNPNTGKAGAVNVTVISNGKSLNTSHNSTFTYKLPEITSLNPSSSAPNGGTKITITGKYLAGTSAVNFGNAGGTHVTPLSDTEVTVINPNFAKDTVVRVTAIVQGLASDTSQADLFTYTSADAPGVPMVFTSMSPGTTYIQFLGDSTMTGKYYDESGVRHDLKPNTAYLLQSIISDSLLAPNLPKNAPAVLVNSFSGRLYISFDSALKGMNNKYIPAAQTPEDINYQVRYQYFEPTISNSQMNVDLSYIDFTSISLSLTTVNAPHASNGRQITQGSQIMADSAGAAAVINNGSVLPTSKDQLPSQKFARVISPQLGVDGLYHDFSEYINSLKGDTVYISGTYVGTGNQPSGNPLTQAQSYDYTGVFDTYGNIILTPNTDSGNGHAPGVAPVQRGAGVGNTTGNIFIAYADLNNNTGIYGCNTPYSLGKQKKTAGITNDVYGQVVGDLLAGLNFGYVGSDTLFNGRPIGSLSSTEWWGGTTPEGTLITCSPGANGIYFGDVQNNSKYYNSYAGSISKLTSGYGFPLQDRLGKNLMTMSTSTDKDSYVQVWINQAPIE